MNEEREPDVTETKKAEPLPFVVEPKLVGHLGPVDELLRPDPPVHRVVARGGAQVLGDRDDVRAGLVEVAEGLLDLVVLLAHTEDEVGLGH